MKKNLKLLIGVLSVILTLSSFKYYNTSNELGTKVFLSEHKLNGHFYVVATTNDYRGGISLIHSPNCHCKK